MFPFLDVYNTEQMITFLYPLEKPFNFLTMPINSVVQAKHLLLKQTHLSIYND